MDDYRKKQQSVCCVGGLHCQCCNSYFGKDKPKLNRIARARLKKETRKIILSEAA